MYCSRLAILFLISNSLFAQGNVDCNGFENIKDKSNVEVDQNLPEIARTLELLKYSDNKTLKDYNNFALSKIDAFCTYLKYILDPNNEIENKNLAVELANTLFINSSCQIYEVKKGKVYKIDSFLNLALIGSSIVKDLGITNPFVVVPFSRTNNINKASFYQFFRNNRKNHYKKRVVKIYLIDATIAGGIQKKDLIIVKLGSIKIP